MISVYIPCTPRHFHYVDRVISAYRAGTVQPDEIVVGLCDAGRCVGLWKNWTGSARLEPESEPLQAGPNRQRALELCRGDIVAYQDADDLPLANRIEAIKWAFDTHDIMALCHGYYFSDELFIGEEPYQDSFIEPERIFGTYFPNGELEECVGVHAFGERFGTIHAGACAIKRGLLEDNKWRSAESLPWWAPSPRTKSEDYVFNMELLHKYKATAILSSPLYIYAVVR